MAVAISGFCEQRFAPLKDAFAANFTDGLEIGASLAVTHRGRMVADLWAGYADPARTRPWQRDTIVAVASTTKIIMMVAGLIAIDRGLIELDRPVADYWPEFAQGGKAAVTVRDAFTHQAGAPGFDPPISSATASDWAAVTTRLAAEAHWFGGERRVCYHAMTFGHLIGELIRRTDGRRPAQFFREEIGEKIAADFQIGLSSPAELTRLAQLNMPAGAFARDGLAGKLLNSVELHDGSWARRAAEDASGGGYGNGRSIAKVCAIVANGGELDGVRFVSAATIAEAGREQVYGQCPYLGWLRLGLGFALDSKEFSAPSATSMHWGGYGGSWSFIDPRASLSLGYAPNNWVLPPPDLTQIDLAEADARLGRFVAVLRDVLPGL